VNEKRKRKEKKKEKRKKKERKKERKKLCEKEKEKEKEKKRNKTKSYFGETSQDLGQCQETGPKEILLYSGYGNILHLLRPSRFLVN
jgi:hypothetical protein